MVSDHISFHVEAEFLNIIHLIYDIKLDYHKYADDKMDMISIGGFGYKSLEGYKLWATLSQESLTYIQIRCYIDINSRTISEDKPDNVSMDKFISKSMKINLNFITIEKYIYLTINHIIYIEVSLIPGPEVQAFIECVEENRCNTNNKYQLSVPIEQISDTFKQKYNSNKINTPNIK